MQVEHKGTLAAVLSSCLGGTAVVATRHLVGSLDPLTLALARYGLGLLVLGAGVACLRLPLAARRDLPRLVLLGVLFFAGFPLLFNLALTWTTAARGALALATLPLLTLLLAVPAGAERPTARKLAGVLLAFLGVGLALSGDLAAPPGAWRGDLVMLAAAACGAVYNVASRPLLRHHPPLAVIAQAMAVGVTILLPAALWLGTPSRLAALDAAEVTLILYLGLFGGALAFWLWTKGLERTTPTRVAVTVALNPVIAMILGLLLLGESLSPSLLLGLAAVSAGILLTLGPRRAGLRDWQSRAPWATARVPAQGNSARLGGADAGGGRNDSGVDGVAHACRGRGLRLRHSAPHLRDPLEPRPVHRSHLRDARLEP